MRVPYRVMPARTPRQYPDARRSLRRLRRYRATSRVKAAVLLMRMGVAVALLFLAAAYLLFGLVFLLIGAPWAGYMLGGYPGMLLGLCFDLVILSTWGR